jgi:hypothetical protein
MTGVGSALLAWLTGGSTLGALAKVLLAVCGLVVGLVYRRYLGILGADRRRPAERQAYDALRNSLAVGNMAAHLYAERLTRFLDWVDRFFGDAGMGDRTLFPHAFGLRTPAPLWTVAALDRALLYPILTILLIWAVSGHVGPAESALQLRPDVPGWQRGAAAAGVGWMLFAWQTTPRGGTGHFWLDLILGSTFMLGLGVVFRIDYHAAFIFTVLLTALISDFAGSGSGTGGVLGAVAFSVTMGLADHPSDFSSGFAGVAFTVGIAATLLLITIGRVAQRATTRRWRGAFLSLFLPCNDPDLGSISSHASKDDSKVASARHAAFYRVAYAFECAI